MKFKILNGILIIDIFSVLLVLSIILIPSTSARVILGLPFLLFFPGYTLTAALFVKKDGIDNVERVAISLGMSIAVAALIGLGLNYSPWGVSLEPVLYSITAFIMLTSIIALIRRARVQKTGIFIVEFTLNLPKWGEGAFNKYLSIILIIAIFAALGALGYTIAVPKLGERFSEFYMLGIDGKAQDFPAEYIMNNGRVTKVTYNKGTVDVISEFGSITLGIVNHEQKTEVYYVKMTVDNEAVQINYGGANIDTLGPIELKQGEKWEDAINVIPQHIKDNQKVELLLLKGTESAPGNSLHFWINVKSAKSDATLRDLTITSGMLIPTFSSDIFSYTVSLDEGVSAIAVTPTANASNTNITVNGNPANSGEPSGNISLNVGENMITIVVIAEDSTTKTYILTVTRTALRP